MKGKERLVPLLAKPGVRCRQQRRQDGGECERVCESAHSSPASLALLLLLSLSPAHALSPADSLLTPAVRLLACLPASLSARVSEGCCCCSDLL